MTFNFARKSIEDSLGYGMFPALLVDPPFAVAQIVSLHGRPQGHQAEKTATGELATW